MTGLYSQFEYGLNQDVSAGVMVGMNRSKLSVGASKVDGNAGYFGVYSKYDFHNFRLTSGLGYQITAYDGKRRTVNQSYDDKYKDKAINAYADIKYAYAIEPSMTIEPKLGISYYHIKQDAIAEGSAPLSLNVDKGEFNIVDSTIGFDLKKTLRSDMASHYITATLAYKNMLKGADESALSANFGGDNFDIIAPAKADSRVNLALGYESLFDNGLFYNLKANYYIPTHSEKGPSS